MRKREAERNVLSVAIKSIKIREKSRDDIPAILLGLQHIYTHKDLFDEVMSLFDGSLAKGDASAGGRPGMTLWNMLVLATLRQGLGCDYDRLAELANEHLTLRLMLQHPRGDDFEYLVGSLKSNVDLVRPEILRKLQGIVAREDLKIARKLPWRRIGRAA